MRDTRTLLLLEGLLPLLQDHVVGRRFVEIERLDSWCVRVCVVCRVSCVSGARILEMSICSRRKVDPPAGSVLVWCGCRGTDDRNWDVKEGPF